RETLGHRKVASKAGRGHKHLCREGRFARSWRRKGAFGTTTILTSGSSLHLEEILRAEDPLCLPHIGRTSLHAISADRQKAGRGDGLGYPQDEPSWAADTGTCDLAPLDHTERRNPHRPQSHGARQGQEAISEEGAASSEGDPLCTDS